MLVTQCAQLAYYSTGKPVPVHTRQVGSDWAGNLKLYSPKAAWYQ